ncbi:MAG TPA: ABC transporter substrate-binding protein, partial [Gaiellaceae bacterium]|nr:ABC transporter substrate-binding protein [Gaiellaceae bacterium]
MVTVLAALCVSCAQPTDPIRIGVLADCEGAVGGLYDVALGGAELPLLQRGARLAGARPANGIEGIEIGGRRVELVLGCAAEQTDGAVELRRLVESEGAEIVLGPNWVPLGLVTTEYARHRPDVTFVVTSLEVLTHLSPGPNVFRFNLGFAQATAGLGAHAFRDLGWRRAVAIAPRDPAGFGFQAAPVAEFCSLGGTIADRVWLDIDPVRMRSQLERAAARDDVDGFFFLASGPEAGIFLEHLAE